MDDAEVARVDEKPEMVLVVATGGLPRSLQRQELERAFEELRSRGIAIVCEAPKVEDSFAIGANGSIKTLVNTVKELGFAKAADADNGPYWNRFRKKKWR